MLEKEDPDKYLIIFRCVVVMNLLYVMYNFNSLLGMFELLPMPIETHQGLVVRLPFIHLVVNAILLMYCLFINHWFVVLMYMFVLLVQMYLAVEIEYMFMAGYSYGTTVWGGVLMLVYAWYRWIEKNSRNQLGHANH